MSQRYLGGIITANPTTPTMTSESGVWTLEQQFQYSSVWSPEIVGNSLRFRSSASAYLNRTFGTPTNGNTFTWSGWVKRGTFGSWAPIFCPSYAGGEGLLFNTSNQLNISVNGVVLLASNAVYRDPSAWYHIVAVSDMSNATASLRFRVYVNGVEITSWATDVRSSYTSFPYWNKNTVAHYLGYNNATATYLDGYMAECYFVDGQALTPSSFGAYDSTGVWQPLPYTGTYGANGFYIDFSDNSGTTATTLGKDYSGNGNNWTPNNFSLTAGTTYDWMLDSPTNQSNSSTGIGNYCTLNPLDFGTIGGGSFNVPTNGNLDWTGNSTGDSNIKATIAVSSGKWYAEFTNIGSGAIPCVVTTTTSNTANSFPNQAGGYGYLSSAQKANNGTYTSYGATYTSSDVIGIALDLDAGTVTFYKNGASQGQAFSGLSGTFTFGISDTTYVAITANANFGQRPFAYTPPTGFKALNTQNLPDSNITNGAQVMAATTYTGNGATNPSSQAISNGSNNTIGTTFKPDFVWIKVRSTTYSNFVWDSIRGVANDAYLVTNSAATENSDATGNQLSSFNSNGFSVQNTTGGSVGTNNNGSTFVAWQWQAGQGTTSSNTSGTLTSTVSVNATAGFSVLTWTAPGSSQANSVGHGLGVAPSFVIAKSRSGGTGGLGWAVYHQSLGANQYLSLNSTNAASTVSNYWGSGMTSSVVGLPTGASSTGYDNNTGNMVAYCWAAVAGYSAFGSYTGNGSSDGPFVYCGFKPRFILLKNSGYDNAQSWVIYDTSRSTYNVDNVTLQPNSSNAESTSFGADIDILSNGFKVRNSNTVSNASGTTIIYAAFAENPFKIARAR